MDMLLMYGFSVAERLRNRRMPNGTCGAESPAPTVKLCLPEATERELSSPPVTVLLQLPTAFVGQAAL